MQANMFQPACVLWSYDPSQQSVTGLDVVNHLVAYCDPPYCHTELAFPSGEACSVVIGKTVQLRKRTFDERFYTGLVIPSTMEKVQKAREIAARMAEDCVPFGVFSKTATYCSRLVADILLGSDIITEKDGSFRGRVTPSGLHRALDSLPSTFPLRMPAVEVIDFK